jgi:predicted CopG family antitoxin
MGFVSVRAKRLLYMHTTILVMSEDTNIRIKIDTWDRLRQRKSPGDSFDEVIQNLLSEAEEDIDSEHHNREEMDA